MKLVVGLGNPGSKYETTRHNAGFMVLDQIVDELSIDISRSGWKGLYGKGKVDGVDIMLLKPQTYMNVSGQSVAEVCNFFKVDAKDVIVIYDDLDLPLGKMKVRSKGSAGGHRGMESIINLLNTDIIARVKVGIGRSEVIDPVDYVLGTFSEEEWDVMKEVLGDAAKAAISLCYNSVDSVMNRFNG